jgi:polyisoprenoid-binding protein YceI
MNDKPGGLTSSLPQSRLRIVIYIVVFAAIAFGSAGFASVPVFSQVTDFKLDPARTTVKFELDALLHKVEGTFQVEPGTFQLDLATGQASGAISVNAKSGTTGNAMRDRKMHNDVLESGQYPDIVFRPDRVSGTVARSGKSSVMVHGLFRIHGVDREISVPAVVEMTDDSWTATIHFTVPYVKWGMKNPSNLFLHVAETVEIDLNAAGSIVIGTAKSAPFPKSPRLHRLLEAGLGSNSLPLGAFVRPSGSEIFEFFGSPARPINHHTVNTIPLLQPESDGQLGLRKITGSAFDHARLSDPTGEHADGRTDGIAV